MVKIFAFISLFLFSIQSLSATNSTVALDKYVTKSGRKIMVGASAVFGNVAPNGSSTVVVTLTNTWTMPAEVRKVDPTNSSLSPEFWHFMPQTITLGPDNCLGVTLQPTETCTMSFTYRPLFNGDSSHGHLTYYAYNVEHSIFLDFYDIGAHGYSYNLPPEPTINPPPPTDQLCRSGSIIDIDDQILRERVPLVGIDFSLYYSTTYSNAFKSGYNSATKIRSFNPEGFSISSHNYFEMNTKRLFKGDGTSRQVVPSYLNSEYIVVDGGEVYAFDSSGFHLTTRSALTGELKYSFSYLNGRLVGITDSYGKLTTLNRNSLGELTSIQGPFGQITSVTRASHGYLASVTNPKGETYSFTYKAGTTLLETFTKPGGQVSTFTYDDNGRLTKDTGHGGNFTEFFRSVNSTGTARLLNEVTAEGTNPFYEFWGVDGNTYRYYEDSSGQQRENGQYANGNSYDWTPTESTSKEVVDDGRWGSAQKRISKIDLEKEGVYSTTYFSQTVNGLVTWPFGFTSIVSGTSTSGRNHSTVYTKASNTFTNTSHEGVSEVSTLDAHDRIVSSKVGADTPWTFTYNSLGQLVEATQGLKNTITNTFYSNGLLQKSTNVLGQETSYVYDLAGRVTQKTLPNGKVIISSYDLNGNLTGVTPPSRPEHVFSLNSMELMGQYQPPTLAGLSVKDTLFSYNLDKQVTNILKPDGQSVAMVYDSGYTNLLQEVQLSRGSSVYTYPTGSNLMQQSISADGITSTFNYYGSTVKAEDQKRASDGYLYAKYSYEFDGDHRLVSRTLRGHSVASTSVINTSYNSDDVPTQIGDLNITYEYPSGRLGTTSLANISDVRTYDVYGSLASYTSTYLPPSAPAQVLYSYSLIRDAAGRVTQKTEVVLGSTDVFAYTYDVNGRLATVTKNASPYSNYTYDDNGNRLSGVHATHAFTSTYDAQDRLLTYNSRVYSYNANGDNTHIQWNTAEASSFSYDALGSLIGAVNKDGKALSFKYDGAGNLVQTDLNGATTTRRIYETNLRIAAQYTNGGNDVKEFIYFSNVNSPEYMIHAGVKYRFLKDHLGSPRLIAKASDGTIVQRIDYTDLGKIIANTNTSFQPYAFAGGINENYTKLVKFGARYYDPETGRWTTKDPILFRGGDANLYGYVSNDPINFIDPLGTTQLDLDLALGWLATVHPELFANNINPKFVNKTIIGASGETINQDLINIDMSQLDKVGCEGSDIRVRQYVNIVGHELMHAQDWKKYGEVLARIQMFPSEDTPGTRHNMIYNKAGILGAKYFNESP